MLFGLGPLSGGGLRFVWREARSVVWNIAEDGQIYRHWEYGRGWDGMGRRVGVKASGQAEIAK
jgi:hypothetical protein